MFFFLPFLRYQRQTVVNPKKHCNYSTAVKGSTAVVREGLNECLRCGQERALRDLAFILSFFSLFQIGGRGAGGKLSKQNTWLSLSV